MVQGKGSGLGCSEVNNNGNFGHRPHAYQFERAYNYHTWKGKMILGLETEYGITVEEGPQLDPAEASQLFFNLWRPNRLTSRRAWLA